MTDPTKAPTALVEGHWSTTTLPATPYAGISGWEPASLADWNALEADHVWVSPASANLVVAMQGTKVFNNLGDLAPFWIPGQTIDVGFQTVRSISTGPIRRSTTPARSCSCVAGSTTLRSIRKRVESPAATHGGKRRPGSWSRAMPTATITPRTRRPGSSPRARRRTSVAHRRRRWTSTSSTAPSTAGSRTAGPAPPAPARPMSVGSCPSPRCRPARTAPIPSASPSSAPPDRTTPPSSSGWRTTSPTRTRPRPSPAPHPR